jgi:hypothetical protein
MKESDYIEKTLSKVQQVEPSPYLFTRIEAKIQSLTNSTVSMKKVFIGMTLTCMLLVLNFIATSSSSKNSTSNSITLLDELNLNTSNQLYNE